jgi:ABC-type nickel/cobalt efflux system permease component RcnA
MDNSIALLSVTAVSLGFVHTILGPDHYVPFIVLSEAKKWSIKKTMWITFLCGLGHVVSSIILGLVGIAVGISVNKLVEVESFRGNIAGWLFIAFGLVYMVISVRNIYRKKKHTHSHYHVGGDNHTHEHNHHESHVHLHENDVVKTTPWILFLIFVFGPCEPLIPILMYPQHKIICRIYGCFRIVCNSNNCNHDGSGSCFQLVSVSLTSNHIESYSTDLLEQAFFSFIIAIV